VRQPPKACRRSTAGGAANLRTRERAPALAGASPQPPTLIDVGPTSGGPPPAGVPRRTIVRLEATCVDAKGNGCANCTFVTGQRELTAVLLVLAAQHAHSKLQAASRACPDAARRLPRLTRSFGGSECSRRDAVQFEPPEAARPPANGSAACQLVRVVRRCEQQYHSRSPVRRRRSELHLAGPSRARYDQCAKLAI
jgi:hypothetical protein